MRCLLLPVLPLLLRLHLCPVRVVIEGGARRRWVSGDLPVGGVVLHVGWVVGPRGGRYHCAKYGQQGDAQKDIAYCLPHGSSPLRAKGKSKGSDAADRIGLILFAVPVRHLLTGERDGLGVLRRTSRAGSYESLVRKVVGNVDLAALIEASEFLVGMDAD